MYYIIYVYIYTYVPIYKYIFWIFFEKILGYVGPQTSNFTGRIAEIHLRELRVQNSDVLPRFEMTCVSQKRKGLQ